MNDVVDYGKLYNTFSQFVLRITPLPPYYMDIIEQLYPDRTFPKRKFKNVAGDEFELAYQVPEVAPGKDDEDYLLHCEYISVVEHNQEMVELRRKRREDFLLAMCITIESGPISIESVEWRQKLEAAFQDVNFTVPTHPGALMLTFLKSVVITKPHEKNDIVQMAVYEEVNMQGILAALQGFQDNMG